MAGDEIITIINNSGKVISTGKQLVSLFKEAQAAYRGKREAVRSERAGIQRAKTFDVGPRDDIYEQYDRGYPNEPEYEFDRRSVRSGSGRRKSSDDNDDTRSYASSRHSRRSRRPRRLPSPERPLALTAGNLKAHSEVSTTTPSKVHKAPQVEDAPRELELARKDLAVGLPRPPLKSSSSDPVPTRKKSIDMNLAYGDIPPDLETRVDLDTGRKDDCSSAHESDGPRDPQETEAIDIMDRIEDYLEEAQCMHHTASSMIENLQRNPEAAAAVALSLAELSAIVGKMSPAFLAFLKGGSPAVFALLASPQFLIGAGVAVGVTVVMFGGWRIVKRLATGGKTLEAPIPMRSMSSPAVPTAEQVDAAHALPPPPSLPAITSASAAGYDEAVVLRDVEELSSIETWRRGISSFGPDTDNEAAEIELLSQEAERALKEAHNRDLDEVTPFDSVSQVSWARPRRPHRSHRSSSHRHRERDAETEVSDRRSSDRDRERDRDDRASEAGSERSHRSTRSHRSSSSRKHHDSGASSVSRSSKHPAKITLKVIEEGDGAEDGASNAGSATGKTKEKKRDMIKQLFKMKKDKDEQNKALSVMV
ncbi:uncharacterized protein C8A04DRAFT_16160 [Dichotomopilus funicola]|uniref:Uncharacterized protein n=1 Tax=Dichotomopilus funicola TaxID=1934379 RepID=A0AAN6UUL5_9PEZI|nr:hypothetical protein C8A04DRAFT_16160 [Dichotomopilus funicola]